MPVLEVGVKRHAWVVPLQGARLYFLSIISLGFVYKHMVIPWFRHYELLTPLQKLLDFKLIFTTCLLSARHQAWAGIWEDCGCNSRIFWNSAGYAAAQPVLRPLVLWKDWASGIQVTWNWNPGSMVYRLGDLGSHFTFLSFSVFI